MKDILAMMLGGGAVGGGMGVFTAVLGLVNGFRQDRKELLMADKELEMQRYEAESALKKSAIETDGEGYVAGIKAAEKRWSNPDTLLGEIAAFLRDTARPILTYILLVLYAVVAIWVFITTAPESDSLQEQVWHSISYLTSMALGFWFLDRSASKHLKK